MVVEEGRNARVRVSKMIGEDEGDEECEIVNFFLFENRSRL